MKDRYWMFLRKGVFYVEDKQSGKQKSLKTRDAAAARRMFAGMNQKAEQPQMNVEMAKVYLSSKSVEMLTRSWEDVMNDMREAYRGSTLHRWQVVIKSQPFQELRKIQLLDTTANPTRSSGGAGWGTAPSGVSLGFFSLGRSIFPSATLPESIVEPSAVAPSVAKAASVAALVTKNSRLGNELIKFKACWRETYVWPSAGAFNPRLKAASVFST